MKAGGSITWGVYTTDPNGTAEAQIRLKGSKGSLIGIEMRNLYDGIACVMVELAPTVSYSVQTSATGAQTSCKVVLSAGS